MSPRKMLGLLAIATLFAQSAISDEFTAEDLKR